MAYNSKYTGVEVESLLEKVEGLTVPTKTSELANDSGYITDAALSGYATTSAVEAKQDKLAYYAEEGTTVALTMPDGEDNKVAINTGNDGNMSVAVGQDCEVTVGQTLKITSEDVDVYSSFAVFSAHGTNEILTVIKGTDKAYYNKKEIATLDDVKQCAQYEEFLPSLLHTLPRNMDYGVMANVFYVMYPYQIALRATSPQVQINGSDYEVTMEEYGAGIYKITPSGFRMTAVGELAITFPSGLFTLYNADGTLSVASSEIYVYCPESDPLTGR